MPTRLLAAVAALFALAAGPAATASTPMGFDDARHLLVRTGFGPTDTEVRAFAGLTREQAVTQLLRDVRTEAATTPPAWVNDSESPRYPRGTSTEEERKAFTRQWVREGVELRAWWVQEMLATASPLTERMTLFWHNHFVSGQQKVRFGRLMYEQNATLRANAVGNFATLLHAASKGPAMLIYLDVAQSRKGQPNENFAREVMELFTLGEGQYTEQDIKEAARAFTGWSLDRETGKYLFRPGVHDTGDKTVLGSSGRFDGDAVLDIILTKPQTSEYITTKLWREFVSDDPDPREVKRIAQIFRGQHYDIKAALRALFLSDAFWASDNRGTLVKSPVELVVGTLRQLEVAPASAMPFAVASAGMGQSLFAPPNVKGWPGGETWINSNTLLARKQFLDRLARTDSVPLTTAIMADAQVAMTSGEPMLAQQRTPKPAVAPQEVPDEDKARAQRFAQQMDRALRNVPFDAAQWVARRPGTTPDAKLQAAQALLLPLAPVVADRPRGDVDAVAFVRATLLDPAYQLK